MILPVLSYYSPVPTFPNSTKISGTRPNDLLARLQVGRQGHDFAPLNIPEGVEASQMSALSLHSLVDEGPCDLVLRCLPGKLIQRREPEEAIPSLLL